MIRMGFAKEDITPEPGLPLSGFAFRENMPSTHVDDPLHVRALLIEQEGQYYCLISLEILGIGAQLEYLIINNLQNQLSIKLDTKNIILTAVHNHSAPITTSLAGEADPDQSYLALIAKRTVDAMCVAINNLQSVVGSYAEKDIVDLTYNRRAVLSDGRVTMEYEPEQVVIERGPLDNRLTLLVFKNEQGQVIGSIAHFPCHGVAVCTSGITHDVPGRISKELEDQFSTPCLFLQGGAGDINPTIVSTSHDQLDKWSDSFRNQCKDLPSRLLPFDLSPLASLSKEVQIPFQPLQKRETIINNIQMLERIAAGDREAPELMEAIRNIANIINLPGGELPDPQKANYFANALVKNNQRILEIIDSGKFNGNVPLQIKFFRLGRIRMAFVGAELFACTGMSVRRMVQDGVNLLVTYSGPVIGYIPDEGSMERGGYESNDAWMFYFQPAPFAPNALNKLEDTLRYGLNAL
jgi:neutral ceramidase